MDNVLIVPAVIFSFAALASAWMFLVTRRIDNFHRRVRMQLRIASIMFFVMNAYWAFICWNS